MRLWQRCEETVATAPALTHGNHSVRHISVVGERPGNLELLFDQCWSIKTEMLERDEIRLNLIAL